MTVSLIHIDNLYVWDLEGGVRLASPDMVSDQGPAGSCREVHDQLSSDETMQISRSGRQDGLLPHRGC